MSSVKSFSSNKNLMNYLKDSGSIKSDFVFDIMCSVDRKHFINNDVTSYTDRPQLVAYDKTTSAPHMHAKVLEYLSDKLRNGGRVLDIGSGSGYLTTCMAMAFRKPGIVVGIDCISGFQNMAQKIVQNNYPELLSNNRIEFVVGDGRQGYPIKSPYNIIHVGLSATDVPQTLLDQLAPDGCLIMPIGERSAQTLCLVNKSLTGVVERKQLCHVRYGYFDDVKDMNLLKSSNIIENANYSISDRITENGIESFEKVVKNSIQMIEKKIDEFQFKFGEKIDSITLQFNEKCKKSSEDVLNKINNIEKNLNSVESEFKVFNKEMQTKFKEYHNQVSQKFEGIEQRISALSDEFQQSNEVYRQKEKQIYSDNLTEIKKFYDGFAELFECQKTEMGKTNLKWNKIDQELQYILIKWEREQARIAKEKLSQKKSFEKHYLQANNQGAYENLEKKLNTFNEQLKKQNEKIDIHEKILEILISISKKEEAYRAAKKKEKKQKLEMLTETLIELNKKVKLIEHELKSELERRDFMEERSKND